MRTIAAVVLTILLLPPFTIAEEAETALIYDVPDAPTVLSFTSDSVNADGKTKAPGEALITRIRVADENGLGDVHDLSFTVERADGTPIARANRTDVLAGNATQTSLVIEDRFARAPLSAGEYRVNVTAASLSGTLSAVRTFRIQQSKPVFVAAEAPAVPVVAGGVANVTFTLGDKNGAVTAEFGEIAVRVLRGSSAQGWNATLSAPAARGERDGLALADVLLQVEIPRTASAALYRVAILSNGATLGSANLTVREPTLPAIKFGNVTTAARGGVARIQLAITGFSTVPTIAFELWSEQGRVDNGTSRLTLADGALRVNSSDLPAGPYRIVATATASGESARADTEIVVASWSRLRISPAQRLEREGSSLVAAVDLVNEGNLDLGKLAVRVFAEGSRRALEAALANATIELSTPHGAIVQDLANARAVLEATPVLRAGERGVLRLIVPDPGPMPAGTYEVKLRVAGVFESS